jgi:hypothetical protein
MKKYKKIDTGTGAIIIKIDKNTTVQEKSGVYQIRQEFDGIRNGILLDKNTILALAETIKDM